MDDEYLKDSNDAVLLSNSCVDDKGSGLYIPGVIFYSESLITLNPTGEALKTHF